MRLEGKLFKGSTMIGNHVTEIPERPGVSRTKMLDVALVTLCRDLEIPRPIWLSKNTREFARFHQTIFFDGQFTESVPFDQFQIHWIA